MRVARLVLASLPLSLALAACTPTPPPQVAMSTPPAPPPASSTTVIVPYPAGPQYAANGVTPDATYMSPVRLSAADTQMLLTNNTAVGLSGSGMPYEVYYSVDGTAHFTSPRFNETGRWRVSAEGNLCTSLPSVASGEEHCYMLSRVGRVVLYNRPDGYAEGSIRVLTGNPQNL